MIFVIIVQTWHLSYCLKLQFVWPLGRTYDRFAIFMESIEHFADAFLLFFFTFAAGDSKSLKILLSFAVGGLLGDVFLHLLPEAWSADLSSVKENSTLF